LVVKFIFYSYYIWLKCILDGSYDYYVTATVNGIVSNPSEVVSVLITDINNMDALKVEIYPNPTTDVLYLSSDNLIESIEMYNQMGQLVLRKDMNAFSDNLDLSALPKALYTLKIKSVHQVRTQSVLKN